MREYNALKRQWRSALDYPARLYAGLQATLHNIHFRGPTHPQPWKPDDFIGGGAQKRPQTVEEKMAIAAAMLMAARPQNPEAVRKRLEAKMAQEPING